MSLHPAVVHVPIGLLLMYSLSEMLTIWLKQKEWTFVKLVLLFFGLLGTAAAVASGFVAMENLSNDDIAEVHMAFALTTIALYAVIAAAYFLRLKKLPGVLETIKTFILRKPVIVVLALLGAALLTITGSLGSIMTHGPSNFLSDIVYTVFL